LNKYSVSDSEVLTILYKDALFIFLCVKGLTSILKVLHVDDEIGFLKVAKKILELQGAFQVDIACSVDEAKEKIKTKTYDVIVSDYWMPRKDGLEFLKDLREDGNGIPFIVFTGRGREEVAIKSLNYGADYYINKYGKPEKVYRELAEGIIKSVKVTPLG